MSPESPALGPAQLEQLFSRLEKPVYNTVYRWVWHEDDARDIVQDTFVKLWRIRDTVDMETADALVYKIALNLASNKRRWRKVRTWIGLEAVRQRASEAPDAETRLLGEERALAVRGAVEALPEKYRRVVMLCEFSDLSYQEIGHILGIAEGTVGSRRNTALQKLRVALEDTP